MIKNEWLRNFDEKSVKKPLDNEIELIDANCNLFYGDLKTLLEEEILAKFVHISFIDGSTNIYRTEEEESLNIKWNIREIAYLNQFLQRCSHIRYLILRRYDDAKNSICLPSNLIYLEFHECNLKNKDLHELNKLETLETLSLRHSNIDEFPNLIFRLYKLNVLDLSYTNISFLPDEIRHLRNLRYVNLNGTSINELPDAFQELIDLQSIYMGETNINKFTSCLRKLKKLVHLALWSTEIEQLPEWVAIFKTLKGYI